MNKKKEDKKAVGKPYTITGKGKRTIIFVHCFGGDAGSWQWVIKRLEKKYTCISLNLPGFGGTEALKEPSIYAYAMYINKIIAELELEEYALCGHAMGAKLILYANKLMTGIKPDKLILIAPSPPTVEVMPDDEKERMLRHPNEKEAMTTVANATMKTLKKKKFEYAVVSQLRIDQQTWKWWLEEGMNNNIASRIAGMAIPTFVICAKNDAIISIDTMYEAVLPHVPKPKLIQLGKSGHLIPLEVPRKLARILKRIL
jgi:pimeloyl-ACP methyl ester carboxylesterase